MSRSQFIIAGAIAAAAVGSHFDDAVPHAIAEMRMQADAMTRPVDATAQFIRNDTFFVPARNVRTPVQDFIPYNHANLVCERSEQQFYTGNWRIQRKDNQPGIDGSRTYVMQDYTIPDPRKPFTRGMSLRDDRLAQQVAPANILILGRRLAAACDKLRAGDDITPDVNGIAQILEAQRPSEASDKIAPGQGLHH